MLFEQIKLGKKTIAQYSNYWKDKQLEYTLKQEKARLYLKKTLRIVDSSYATPYNCCNVGSETFARKDGNPITQDDYDALSVMDRGQENKLIGVVGDATIRYDWLCDSSD